jgi:hypothetical protein
MLAELENEGIPSAEECRMLTANLLKLPNAIIYSDPVPNTSSRQQKNSKA